MLTILIAIDLTLSEVYSEEFTAEVRLFSFWTHGDARKCCDLLIARSLPLWNKGGFRKCFAGLPIEIEEGGFITPYTITVNTSHIKNFARNTKKSNTFAVINRKLNLNAQDCATVTGPDWQKTLGDLRTSYPVEINVYTTTADQADINCTAIRDLTKCSPKSCEVQMIPGYMGSQVLEVQFDASICGQLSGSADYRAVVFIINSILNGMKAHCPTIRYTKTKEAFDKVPHEGYYYALVSGPSHVDVCQKAKKHLKYGAHVCEEIRNINRTSAQNKQRTFRMRLVQPINLADIPWYMNEHSKFVHYLNSRSSKCRFNGYVQLNENEEFWGVQHHVSSSRFLERHHLSL